MAEKILSTRISQKIDTTENWETANPILKKGEIGIEINSSGVNLMKIGNGTDAWKDLNYMIACSIVDWGES